MATEVSLESVGDQSCSPFPTVAFEATHALSEALLQFWEKNLLTDVKFRVQDGDQWFLFSAHKLILCMWSPVLEDTVSECDTYGEITIKVTDVLPSVFETMLKFMYGCKSELHSRRKDSNFLLHLCKAAVKYEVEALKATCRNIFNRSAINEKNVLDFLEASQVIGADTIRERCYKLMQSQTSEVLSARGLENVTSETIQTILKFPRVSFQSEFELATCMFTWVKEQSKCGRNYKEVLQEVLPFVKLTSLTAEQFAELLYNFPNSFSDGDALKIFMHITRSLGRQLPLPEWCVHEMDIHRQYVCGQSKFVK